MILPSPLVTSSAIARVLRPGARARPDSALKTLQRNGLDGRLISVVQRSGPTARGRSVYYSALMLDVARSFRRGDLTTAHRARDAGDRLVAGRPARFVAEALTAKPDARLDQLDQVAGGAVTRLALLTEAARRDLYDPDELPIRWSGTVASVTDGLTTLRTSNGSLIAVPGPLPVGMTVVVDTERTEDQVILDVRSGLQPRSDRNSLTPAEPVLLDPSTLAAKIG